MALKREDIVGQEFIGLTATVLETSDPTLKGLSGVIIDETKNTFRLDAEGKIRTIAKAIAMFDVKLTDGSHVIVQGVKLVGRPEDRIKKVGRPV